jgi:hypothetical protein
MRLGDLDALKEQLEPYRYAICGFEGILALIDNAPTVAVNCKDCDGYEAGYTAGVHDAIRPKGECANCVTCDHFGNCEGCEKGEEE